MSVSKWDYSPEKCDGRPCPGDCDKCIYEDRPRKEFYYHYGMRIRGFSPGAQPDGVIRREDSDEYHDIIVYERPLTAEERYKYDLDLVLITRKETKE